MDGVALASVITSGVLGITTSSIAVWSARHNATLARDTRVKQRLAESYLEVLRIVEREGQWVEASVTNWKLAVEEEAAFGIDAVMAGHVTGFGRVGAPGPAATDRATIAAHLAAFGSDNVREFYRTWRSTITEIGTEEDVVREICDNNYPEGPGHAGMKNLLALHEKEGAARQALADAVAKELGHR